MLCCDPSCVHSQFILLCVGGSCGGDQCLPFGSSHSAGALLWLTTVSCCWHIYACFFVFHTRTHCIVQAGLEHLASGDFSCLSLLRGCNYRPWLGMFSFFFFQSLLLKNRICRGSSVFLIPLFLVGTSFYSVLSFRWSSEDLMNTLLFVLFITVTAVYQFITF